MANLPEWALTIRDEMARAEAIAAAGWTAGKRNVTEDDIQQYLAMPSLHARVDAALAVALPLIAEHMAGVAIDHESGLPPRHWIRSAGKAIAAAIRQESTPHKP